MRDRVHIRFFKRVFFHSFEANLRIILKPLYLSELLQGHIGKPPTVDEDFLALSAERKADRKSVV